MTHSIYPKHIHGHEPQRNQIIDSMFPPKIIEKKFIVRCVLYYLKSYTEG